MRSFDIHSSRVGSASESKPRRPSIRRSRSLPFARLAGRSGAWPNTACRGHRAGMISAFRSVLPGAPETFPLGGPSNRAPVEITYLSDHPAFVRPLAEYLLEHWRTITPEQTLESRSERLLSHCNRDVLPIAWVAYDRQQALGTAALRIHDLEGREDLTPWLGGVYVRPDTRRQGVGKALCSVVEQKAASLGFRELFLFTLDRQDWYSSLGYDRAEPCTWRGHPGVIMRKPALRFEGEYDLSRRA
jgi:GNAT superfamily N-acetyltransferase